MKGVRWSIGCLLLLSQQIIASPVSTNPSLSTSAAVTKIGFVLFFIVAFILFFAWVARRSGFVNFVNNQKFKVLASIPLGTREKAVLLQAGDQCLLLGVTSANISLIHTFAEGENPLHNLEELAAVSNSDSNDFASHVKALLTRGSNK